MAANKKYRMVALDLDGTLLNSNHELSNATIKYMRSLHAKGFVVAIATGRSAACAAHIIEKLDLHYPMIIDGAGTSSSSSSGAGTDGFPLVCNNGARGLRIRKSHSDVGGTSASGSDNNHPSAPHHSNSAPLDDSSSRSAPTNPFLKRTLVVNNELFHNPLSPSMALKTLKLAHKLGCVTNYYHNHHIYAVVRNEKHMELTERYGDLTHGNTELYRYLNDDNADENNEEKNDVGGSDSDDLYNEENGYGYQKAIELGPPSKLLILCDTERLDEITELVRAELNNGATSSNDDNELQANVIRGTPPFFVEILDPTVCKGAGLQQLAQSLSIPLEEIIAFGDGDNDLEFIQMAGWGVAMKNGREVVKGVAEEVCDWTNDEDGVIRTLQRFEEEGKLHFPTNDKKYRMVALDLDGTLLNSNHQLSDATTEYIRSLHARGFVVAIATGRSAACTAHIIETLDLDYAETDGFPLVCTNGARGLRIRKSHSDLGCSSTSDIDNNHPSAPHHSNSAPLASSPTNPFLKQTLVIHNELFHNPLSPSMALKTLKLAHKLGCVVNYYHNHHIYAVVRNEKHMKLTKRYGNAELYRYLNEENLDEAKEEISIHNDCLYNEENGYGYQKAIELGPPSKLLILCDEGSADEIAEIVRLELNGNNSSNGNDASDGGGAQQIHANVIRGTPPWFVEILDPKVCKGAGLQQLAQSLSVPLEEIIAFGDGDNDLEFVQMAGWGVAMKNGREVVKGVAEEVCDWTNDEDGVIRTLQRFEEEGKLHFSK